MIRRTMNVVKGGQSVERLVTVIGGAAPTGLLMCFKKLHYLRQPRAPRPAVEEKKTEATAHASADETYRERTYVSHLTESWSKDTVSGGKGKNLES